MPIEGSVRDRVDRHLGGLTDHNAGDIGLVHLNLSLHDGHVRDRHQHGSSVVHRAHDDCLALIDIAPGHDAVYRRLERHLRELVAVAFQIRGLLSDLLLARGHFLLARFHLCLAHACIVLGALEGLARRQLVLPEVLLALQVAVSPVEIGLCGLDRHPCAFESRTCRENGGLASLHGRLERARVELQQKLAAGDFIAFIDRHAGHASDGVRADVDRALRLNLA